MANANDIVYSRKNATGTDFVEKTLVPVANYFVICGPDGDLTTFTGSTGGGSSLGTGSTYPFTSSWAISSSWSPSTGGTSLNTGSTYPITSSWSETSSYISSNANAFIIGGNSFGTASVLGTTDNYILQLVSNNVTGLTVSSSGKIGIGTSSPDHALTINGPSGTAVGDIPFKIIRNRPGSGTLVQTAFIGLHKTDVDMVDGFGIKYIFRIQDDTSNEMTIAEFGAVRSGGADGTGSLIFNTSNAGSTTEKMRVSHAGDVGIGTTSPQAKLHVVGHISSSAITSSLFGTSSWSVSSSYAPSLWIQTGSTYPITSSWSTTSQTSSFITTPTNAFLQNGNAFATASVLGTTDLQPLQFETNNTIRMTISASNGFVGINTPNPQHPLSVLTSADAQGIQIRRASSTIGASNEFGLRVAGSEGINLAAVRASRMDGNAAHNLQFLTNPTGNNPTVRMTITQFGSVGIGTDAPSASLHVMGDISASAVTASMRISGSLELSGLETTGSTAPVTLQGYFKTKINETNYWVPFYSSP